METALPAASVGLREIDCAALRLKTTSLINTCYEKEYVALPGATNTQLVMATTSF